MDNKKELTLNPYDLNPKVFKLWNILGRPPLKELMSGRWIAPVVMVNPEMVTKLEKEGMIRPRGAKKGYYKSLIKRACNQYLSGEYQDFADTLVTSDEAFFMQGNHRLLGVREANVTAGFKIEINAPSVQNKVLGSVRPWTLGERIDKAEDVTKIANLHFRIHTKRYGYDENRQNEIKNWLESVDEAIEFVHERIPAKTKAISRSAVELALVEGYEREPNKEYYGEIIDCLCGNRRSLEWANRLREHIRDNKDATTNDGQTKEYRECVMVLCRLLNRQEATHVETTNGRKKLPIREGSWAEFDTEHPENRPEPVPQNEPERQVDIIGKLRDFQFENPRAVTAAARSIYSDARNDVEVLLQIRRNFDSWRIVDRESGAVIEHLRETGPISDVGCVYWLAYNIHKPLCQKFVEWLKKANHATRKTPSGASAAQKTNEFLERLYVAYTTKNK